MKKLILLLCLILECNLVYAQINFAELNQETEWGLDFFHYTPPRAASSLLFLLHGCKQSANDFLALTKLLEFAKKNNVHILTAQQNRLYHYDGCWNWFLPQNQVRSNWFELGLLSQHLRRYMETHAIKRENVILIGLSAGAAMANNMATCYPELAQGVMLHSGMPFAPTNSISKVEETLLAGPDRPMAELAQEALHCYSQTPRPKQQVLILHGLGDKRVVSLNAQATAQQWLGMWDIMADGNFDQQPKLKPKHQNNEFPNFPYQTNTWQWQGNQVRLIEIEQLAHLWTGGLPGVPFSEPKGPSSLDFMQEFFKLKIKR